MKSKWIVLSLAVLLMACSGKENNHQPLHSVVTTTANATSNLETKSFSGVIEEKAEISLGFKTSGQIMQIYVKEGDYVHAGQLLARLDDKDYQLGVTASKAQYQQLSNELARMKKLLDAKSISANDYEKAEAGLKQLAVKLQSDENTVKYTRLYASCDGYVQSVNFEKAEMVNAGIPVFSILSAGQMKVSVSIPQEVYNNRSYITHISCKANGQEIGVKQLSIAPKADAAQLYKMLLSVDSNKRLAAGQNVEVNFHMSNRNFKGKLSLPVNAVFNDHGHNYVWVVSVDSTVNRREVQTDGVDAQGNLVIASGINGDEVIVRAGVHALTDKEKVKIIAKPSATNIGGLL